MKILKSKKALSPVVASIILIAVTVAVSIAVAAWMGALSFMFMGGAEQLEVGTPWGWSSTAVKVTVTNAGGSTVIVDKVRVNNTEIDITDETLQPKISKTLTVDLTGQGWNFQQGYQYTIIVITKNNKEFPTTGTYTP
ncbi:MAG: archaellin/type IV pilin N-terminal domain-containing protein [Candidatus Bathycorpusculaceae bacterium]